MSNRRILIDQFRRSNRRWKTLALVASLTLVFAALLGPSAAHAQYGGGYGGGGGGDDFVYDYGPDIAPMPGKPRATQAPNPVLQLLALVNHPAVQDELKLTDDQKAKVKDLASKRTAARARKPGSGSSKPAASSSSAKTSDGSNAPAVGASGSSLPKPLDDLLDADQRKRLGQIALQVEGPLALARPDVAKKINLSAAQVKKVQTIVVETRNQIAQLGAPTTPPTDKPDPGADPGRPDQPPDRAQVDGLRQAAGARVTDEVLKPAQKEAFNQLLGPPFDVAKIRNAPADAVSAKSRPKGKSQPKSRGPVRKP
jgi:hypothetical protein